MNKKNLRSEQRKRLTLIVNNRNSYPINKKIRLFAEDVRGVKYIIDIIHADLEPMQVGNSTSSIPLSKIGTAPHTVVVE